MRAVGPTRSTPELGPFRFAPPYLPYVNDAGAGIIEDAIGADLPDRESRVDRRTACLHQADAFREKAIADPEQRDKWVDEAIKWLERAMEAGRCAVDTLEAGDTGDIPELARGAAADPQLGLITRQ